MLKIHHRYRVFVQINNDALFLIFALSDGEFWVCFGKQGHIPNTGTPGNYCSSYLLLQLSALSDHPQLQEAIHAYSREVANYGELFHTWEMWPSPYSEKPVGRRFSRQDPHPWIGSPVGNQACIVPRLLWGLLLLKLPYPELRQQMFTKVSLIS